MYGSSSGATSDIATPGRPWRAARPTRWTNSLGVAGNPKLMTWCTRARVGAFRHRSSARARQRPPQPTHIVDHGHVDAARGDVRNDEERDLARAEAAEVELSRLRVHRAVNDDRIAPDRAQSRLQELAVVARGREQDRETRDVGVDDVAQQLKKARELVVGAHREEREAKLRREAHLPRAARSVGGERAGGARCRR